MQQLAAHRAAEYNVVLVDAQQVYDQFNGGMMSAEAIHDFLAYAYFNWSTRPTYALLAGDGSYDMRNYTFTSHPTYIPIFLRIVGRFTGETAADNRFVTIEDDPVYGDLLPDINLGRLPVNTAAEAQAIVDKIIGYDNATCNPMPTDVTFVADDEEGGIFWNYSDGVADGYEDPPTNTIKYLPAPYTSTKIYLANTCNYDASGDASSADECRQELVDHLNNTGSLLVSYVGHSAIDRWAVETMWNSQTVDQLTNTNFCQLPVMITMGCNEGDFHDALETAVSEYAVRMTGTGPVASISPTYFGFSPGHDIFEKGFFLAVFNNNTPELGAAMKAGKQKALDTNHMTEADGYLLMGDPAMKLKTTTSGLGQPQSIITKTSNVLEIGWLPVSGATHYDIYRTSNTPYFTPADPAYAQNVTSPWQDPDPNSIGDTANNYFYIVRAKDDSGNFSDGPRHGEFDFPLTPGQ